jgi:O-antigen/teichoic acid export membrane protein
MLLTARAIAKVATVFVVILIARFLSVEGFGTLSTILALTSIIGLLADFGLLLPTIRSLSTGQQDPRELIGKTVWPRAIWSLASIFLAVSVGALLDLSGIALVLLAMAATLEMATTAFIRSFEGCHNLRMVTMLVVIERVVFSLTVTMCAVLGKTLEAVAWGYLVSNTVSFVVAYIVLCRWLGVPSIRFSWKTFVTQSFTGLPFLAVAGFSTVMYRLDTLVINYYRGDYEAGLYNAALRILEAQMFIPMAFMASVFPALSHLFRQDETEFVRVFRRSLRYLLVAGLLLATTLHTTAPFLITILYPDGFLKSIGALKIGTFMLVFYFANFLLSQTLIAINEERTFSIIIVSTALVSAASNLAVVPEWGFLGASWVRVAMEFIMFVSFGIVLRKKLAPMLRARQ